MSYEFSYGMEEDFAVGFVIAYLIVWLLAMAFGIASYVLRSLGVYTIAKRREVKHPWMAWVPMLDAWILGSISDQYHYVTQGKNKNKRKWLIGLHIAYLVVFFTSYIGMFVSVVVEEMRYGGVDEERLIASMLLGLLGMMVAMGVGIAMYIVRYMALYDLYKSCKPDNAVLFLVLSILVNVTEPFFVFACRKHDGGMPPRRPRPAAYIPEQYGYQTQQSPYQPQPMNYQPIEAPVYKAPEYQPPVYQPPVYQPEPPVPASVPVEEPQTWSPAEPESPEMEQPWENQ